MNIVISVITMGIIGVIIWLIVMEFIEMKKEIEKYSKMQKKKECDTSG